MIRRYPGVFRTIPGSRINVEDNAYPYSINGPTPFNAGDNLSDWTLGSTILDKVTLQNSNTFDNAKILGFVVNAKLAHRKQTSEVAIVQKSYGKLGKIYTGLTMDASQSRLEVQAQSVNNKGVISFPSDLSLVDTLWDPARDDLPPAYEGAVGGGGNNTPDTGGFSPVGQQIGIALTLPQSLPFPRGGLDLFIGIWIEPSLMVVDATAVHPHTNPVVLDAKYSIVYDDGGNP